MRVLHCCLAAFYIDNYGYQENILPRMHKLQGHDVMIIASTETYVDKVHLGYTVPGNYINENGIPVHRIPYNRFLPHKFAVKLRYYTGLYEELRLFKPDFIFLHDVQFLSIKDIVQYIKDNPEVKVNADCHSDFRNSARGFISKNVLHGILYKHCVKQIMPYIGHFYGTLPARVDFLKIMYGTPDDRTDLLVMGADDQYVQLAKESNQRATIRKRYNIEDNTFLIVAGGKFDSWKRWILDVMDAVKLVSYELKVKLLVFGSVMEEEGFKDEFDKRCDGKIVQYVGWIKGNESYNYFEASDLVIFAGLHSVLWEQAVGQGKPCIFKRLEGFSHIDLGGNCKFIQTSDKEEIVAAIKECINDYPVMLRVAKEKGLKVFSYSEIAKKALL